MLSFIGLLPQTEWITTALDEMLKKPERWCSWAVAFYLRQCISHSNGKAQMLAEISWIQRLSSMDRAIASSAPVTITSAVGDNLLYVASGSYRHNKENGTPFCWKGEWTPEYNKELWRLSPAPTGPSDFYIVSVFSEEYLYASSIPQLDNVNGYSRMTVLVCAKKCLPDSAGIWRLVKLDMNMCALYDINQGSFLSSPAEAADGSRRAVVTSTYQPLNEKQSMFREWKITASSIPLLELAMLEFFNKDYSRAVQTFTSIISEEIISIADRKKALCYRMVANWMINDKICADRDIALLEPLGGCPEYFLVTLYGKLAVEERKLFERFTTISLQNRAEKY
ncbi:uncharacterized protein PHALS_07293 [Plasmopara halstedii]|uniref:Uncharacterized protein n=1 Tax=Plasmopara halstedii TaxID=4781 RepID=A0A0P1B656_PLAHL|nr:uncharacterized protein PHALS_07293 [Plasmopara halstedii]CEG49535.1 hypothetical protein PHALS_07293 [Plasmopara halstedii]|eukprot:XP_024585904.1 hypothetical protein PHALS_07293 [Plasmopara halstedii]